MEVLWKLNSCWRDTLSVYMLWRVGWIVSSITVLLLVVVLVDQLFNQLYSQPQQYRSKKEDSSSEARLLSWSYCCCSCWWNQPALISLSEPTNALCTTSASPTFPFQLPKHHMNSLIFLSVSQSLLTLRSLRNLTHIVWSQAQCDYEYSAWFPTVQNMFYRNLLHKTLLHSRMFRR